mmetsp:Transcript_20351/g.47274  ORF Transcript_20351/g.47274 Transcript_20351/m.47274 type:complete len:115 (-) Transcript_20351:66-410(-)
MIRPDMGVQTLMAELAQKDRVRLKRLLEGAQKRVNLKDRVREALRLAETETGSRRLNLSRFQTYYEKAHQVMLEPKKEGFQSMKRLMVGIGLEVQDNAGKPGTDFIEYGEWIEN